MEYSYDLLLILRENTTLDPISYLKVLREREKAMERRRLINEKEHCDIAVDFTRSNQLEANLRFEIWKKKVSGYWLKYRSNVDFEEFALDYLLEQKPKKQKKLIKK